MTQKKDFKIATISFLITVVIISLGTWLFKTNSNLLKSSSNSEQNHNSLSSSINQSPVADKVSFGEKILVDRNPHNLKQAAASDFAKGNYQQAISRLETVLQKQRNDPETLIYLNNARIANNPAYAIAVVIPIEGEIDVAQEILRGVAQAQNKINHKGGIDGKQLKVIIANDRNSKDTGQQLATAFVQEPDILGIIGHFSSDVTLAAAEIYQKNGLVVISPTSTSVALSYAGSYIFRTVSSDCLTGNTLAEYLVDNLKLQHVALFYNSANSYSNSLREVFRNKLNKKNGVVVAEFNFNEPNFDIVDALQKTTKESAEALILFPNSSGFNAIETIDKTLLILQRNAGKLPVLGGDSLYKPKILQLAQENAEGMILAIPWHSETTEAQFSQTATRLWGGTVNWRTALSYDATMALAKAIENAPTRQGIQQMLASQDFAANGASGLVRFLTNGDRDTEVELVKVTVGSNSGFGYDFVPIANTATSSRDACQVQN